MLYRVTIPEGLTSQQIVERLKGEENLTGEVSQIPAEGSLLPETYSIEKGMSRQELLMRMQVKHKQILEAAWERKQTESPLKTPQEAVILASIIEKETGRADERERISGVFTNRLLKGMVLQSDPTILYGIYGGGVSVGQTISAVEEGREERAQQPIRSRAFPRRRSATQAAPQSKLPSTPPRPRISSSWRTAPAATSSPRPTRITQAAVQNWRKVEKGHPRPPG